MCWYCLLKTSLFSVPLSYILIIQPNKFFRVNVLVNNLVECLEHKNYAFFNLGFQYSKDLTVFITVTNCKISRVCISFQSSLFFACKCFLLSIFHKDKLIFCLSEILYKTQDTYRNMLNSLII